MSIKDRLMTYAEVLEHESMKKHTTFKIGGFVDYYIYPKNCTALMCVLDILAEENIPYYVLGRGSNVLCSDTDFHGAIINLDRTLNDRMFNYKYGGRSHEKIVDRIGMGKWYSRLYWGMSVYECRCL